MPHSSKSEEKSSERAVKPIMAHRPARKEEPDLLAFDSTDHGNAERLYALHGESFRYCNALGWIVWNGERWQVDGEDPVRRLALETARKLYEQAESLKNFYQREAWVKHSLRCESSRSIRRTVNLAKTLPGVTASAALCEALKEEAGL